MEKMKKEIIEALKIIHEKMQDIKWYLIGSANLSLQGMDFSPNDLDIIVSVVDFPEISKIFNEFLISDMGQIKSSIKDVKLWKLKLKINNIDIEILGEDLGGFYIKDLKNSKLDFIKLGEITIPCRTLESEINAYEKLNRTEKAELIKNFLNKK